MKVIGKMDKDKATVYSNISNSLALELGIIIS
jgi:hypothetical protein